MKHILKTRTEIATRRAAAIARAIEREQRAIAREQRVADRRSEWQRRLDPAAYSCRMEGEPGARVWIAEGPADQRFRFTQETADGSQVRCASHTGHDYILTHDGENGGWVCDCPTPEEKRAQQGGCKHEIAFAAVLQAARMQKQMRRAA